MTTDLDNELLQIARTLETAAPAVSIQEIIDRPEVPDVVPVASAPSSASYHRLALAAVVIVLIAATGVAIDVARRSSDTIDLTGMSSTSESPHLTRQPEPGADPAATSDRPDEVRTILDEPANSDRPRYLRIWNRTQYGSTSEVLLSEQWFDPSGIAVGGSEFVSDNATGSGEWLETDRVLQPSQLLRADGLDRNLGYPEQDLPSNASDLASVLMNPNTMGSETPGVFMTVSTGAGIDSAYLPATATAAGELTRLLPTIMDPVVRQAAYDVAGSLEGARDLPATTDLLGRPSNVVTIPFPISDPQTEAAPGVLEVTFWFNPENSAPHQIEWRLTGGTLGDSGPTVFSDTTVIVAAGAVRRIPQGGADGEPPTATTVTTPGPTTTATG